MTAVERPGLGAELRRLAVPVYLPWSLPMLGGTVLLPVLPLYLIEQGISLSLAGVIIGAVGVGSVLGGVPASVFGQRFGNDTLMFVSVAMQAGVVLAFGFTELAVALVVLRVATGIGMSGTRQSRQVYIARSVDVGVRGRVMSLVGGTHRFTFVVGPLLGGWVYDMWGSESVFVVAAAITAVGLLWIALPGGADPHDSHHRRVEQPRVGVALRRHGRLLARVSLGPMLIMAAREGRYVVIPLFGDRFELSASAIGALVAVGTAADFVLFPVAGFIMDRFGRLYSMVPAFGLMALGLLLLAVAGSTSEVVVAGIVIGVGNGLSSGSMLTMSTDLAPSDAYGPFIAGFSMAAGVGRLVGPTVVGWAAESIGLGASAFALAITLGLGLSWVVFVIGETGRSKRVD